MNPYASLAACYDAFTQDVEYDTWADYLEELFARYGERPESILDLGCGTGSLALLLAQRGYEVIGADASEEMLAQAQAKVWQLPEGTRPLFLHQDMEQLDLYGTVDAAVCCLDSINYLSGMQALKNTFSRLRYFVRPGGLFIFDVNTQAKFQRLDGNVFLRENTDYFCTWSAEYDQAKSTCRFCYDIFARRGALWQRFSEEHQERAFADEEIHDALDQSDFECLDRYGELSFSPPEPQQDRVFYVARRKTTE